MTRVYSGDIWTIDRFVSGFSNNAFLVTCQYTSKSLIVDTPGNPVELKDSAAKTDVQAILITHSHWDHLEGLSATLDKFDVPVYAGKGDFEQIEDKGIHPRHAENDLLIKAGGVMVRAISVPGHTPGSTCYLLPGESPGKSPHLFSGDTLFPGGPGKTRDASSFERILESIETRLLTLPLITKVLPGHGEFTTIQTSKEDYAVFKSKPRKEGEFGDVVWRS